MFSRSDSNRDLNSSRSISSLVSSDEFHFFEKNFEKEKMSEMKKKSMARLSRSIPSHNNVNRNVTELAVLARGQN